MSGRILWVSEGSRVSWSYAKGNKGWSLENMSARHIDTFDLSEIYLCFTRFSPSMDGESQGNRLPEQRVAQRYRVYKKRLGQDFIELQMPHFSHRKIASRVNGSVPW